MSAEIQSVSDETQTVDDEGTATVSVRVVGVPHHEDEEEGEPTPVGIENIPVTFTLGGEGCAASIVGSATATITETSDESGNASASVTLTSGRCTVTASSGQATGGPLAFEVQALADLTVSSSSGPLTVTPSQTTRGGLITISGWTVTNQGSSFGLTAGVLTGVYASTDAIITPGVDTRFSGVITSAENLQGGQSFSHVALTASAPALAPGQYYIGIFVDELNTLAESNEANNYVITSNLLTIVQSTPPTVSAGGPYTVPEGGTVTLQGTATDTEGGPLSFIWDLNSDGILETPGETVTLSAATFDGPNTRDIVLRVTDPSGLSTFALARVNTTNVPPTATLSRSHETVYQNVAVTFTLSEPNDPSVADAAALRYTFECNGLSLAEATYANSGPGASVTCTYGTVANSQTFRALIIDKNGDRTEYTMQFAVNPPLVIDPCGADCGPPPICTVNCLTVIQSEDALKSDFGGAVARHREPMNADRRRSD
jgi:hypothetical protein